MRRGIFLPCVVALCLSISAQAADRISIGFLSQAVDLPPALSNLDEPPEDEGVAGARLAIKDNNTTGRFTGQEFELIEVYLEADGDTTEAMSNLIGQGVQFIVLDLDAAALDRAMQAVADHPILLFNARAEDRRFRAENCHPALLHTALSRDMRTDAMAQYFAYKKWREWFVVTGPRDEDALFAAAVKRSARKFGLEVVEERQWTGEHDARRTAQAEVPLFTQGVDYDVLVVADEIGDFGDYLEFRTWSPRPVAGTQGLVASSWARPLEQWGAAQLQERFIAAHERWMLPRDYAAWVAVRSIGEGAARSRSTEFAPINEFVRSDKFKLAIFKGRKASYRSWNGQLRQPVPIMTARSLVSQAPLEGFLHPVSEMDTLGIDQPEKLCEF